MTKTIAVVATANADRIQSTLRSLGVVITAQADALACDALVFDSSNVDADTLLAFHANERPVAAISKEGIAHLAKVFAKRQPTLAGAPTAGEGHSSEIFWEACSPDDFVTDRDNRLITTEGLTTTAISRALAELANLA